MTKQEAFGFIIMTLNDHLKSIPQSHAVALKEKLDAAVQVLTPEIPKDEAK